MDDFRTFRFLTRSRFRLGIALLLGLGATGAWADWNVSIGAASTNGAWSGGSPDVWTPSASGATVAAAEIASRLAGGTPVTIRTGGGGGAESGDLTVNRAVAWNANGLTLAAGRHIAINANLNGGGSASLALDYGQGAVAAGNTAQYTLGGGAKVGLPAGANFSTKLGSDGTTDAWTVITSLGVEGDASVAPTPMSLQGMATGPAGRYVLGADIAAAATAGWNGGAGFTPIGYVGACGAGCFTGKFDGLGHAISGLAINLAGADNHNYGLFGSANNAVLQNLGLLNVNIQGGANGSTGALAGRLYGSTAARNVYVDGGSVSTATQGVGGLVGATMNTSSISHSYAKVGVSAAIGGGSGQASAGGLVGINNGSISYCYATGSVSAPTGNAGGRYVGGLVGLQNSGSISHSYATGAVSGNNALGGLAGTFNGGSVAADSYWDKDSTGQAGSAGSAATNGKTTAEMHSAAFWSGTGWDIDTAGGGANIWRFYDGAPGPVLKAFLVPAALTVIANAASKARDGVAWGGGNGVSYSTPPDANVLGSVSYGGTSQGAVNVGAYNIVPGGLYSYVYDIVFTNGVLAILPAASGASPSGSGTIAVAASGGGAGSSPTCDFTASQFIPANNPPAGMVFPHGLFDFTLGGCAVSGAVTLTLTYPTALPAGTRFMKYGPTTLGGPAQWYDYPGAVIAGNQVTLTLTDGLLGDDDWTANGTIVDAGGPAVPLNAADIPTLSEWGLILLSLLLAGLAWRKAT